MVANQGTNTGARIPASVTAAPLPHKHNVTDLVSSATQGQTIAYDSTNGWRPVSVSSTHPTATPNVPVIFSVSTAVLYNETERSAATSVTVTLTLPSTYTDSSTFTSANVGFTAIRWRYNDSNVNSGTATNWVYQNSAGATLVIMVTGLRRATNLEVQASVVDVWGNGSAWTGTTSITTAADSTPPGVPSTPTLLGKLGGIQVKWDGLITGSVAQPKDYAYTDIHISTTSGFTPSSTTKSLTVFGPGQFLITMDPSTGAALVLNTATPTTYFIKLVSYDSSGNASTPSTQVSAAPAFTLSTATGTGTITLDLASFNARTVGGITTSVGTTTPSSPVAGDIWIDTTPANVTSKTINSIGFSNPTVTVTTSAAHGFVAGDSVSISGTTGAVNDGVWKVLTATSTQFTYTDSTGAAQPGVAGTVIKTGVGGIQKQWSGSAWTTIQLDKSSIAANTITATQMAAGAIVAGSAVIDEAAISSAQIASLSAGKITAGTLSAQMIISGTNFTTGQWMDPQYLMTITGISGSGSTWTYTYTDPAGGAVVIAGVKVMITGCTAGGNNGLQTVTSASAYTTSGTFTVTNASGATQVGTAGTAYRVGSRLELSSALGLVAINSSDQQVAKLTTSGGFTLNSGGVGSTSARIEITMGGLALYNSFNTPTVQLNNDGTASFDGSVSAQSFIAPVIKTSSTAGSGGTGAGVVLDSSGLRAYNGTGLTVNISSTGSAAFSGAITASTIDVGSTAVSGSQNRFQVLSTGVLQMNSDFGTASITCRQAQANTDRIDIGPEFISWYGGTASNRGIRSNSSTQPFGIWSAASNLLVVGGLSAGVPTASKLTLDSSGNLSLGGGVTATTGSFSSGVGLFGALTFTNSSATVAGISIVRGDLTIGAAGGGITVSNGNVNVTGTITGTALTSNGGRITYTNTNSSGKNLWFDFLAGTTSTSGLFSTSFGHLLVDTGSNLTLGGTSISVTPNIHPTVDNAVNLGNGTFRWATVFAVSSTINTSDVRLKTDVVPVDEFGLGLDFITRLRPVKYRWLDGGSVARTDANGQLVLENHAQVYDKVPAVRPHTGLLAQEVREALTDSGVEDWGGWVLDDKADPDSSQSLRYEEFISPLISAVQTLNTRLLALETAQEK